MSSQNESIFFTQSTMEVEVNAYEPPRGKEPVNDHHEPTAEEKWAKRRDVEMAFRRTIDHFMQTREPSWDDLRFMASIPGLKWGLENYRNHLRQWHRQQIPKVASKLSFGDVNWLSEILKYQLLKMNPERLHWKRNVIPPVARFLPSASRLNHALRNRRWTVAARTELTNLWRRRKLKVESLLDWDELSLLNRTLRSKVKMMRPLRADRTLTIRALFEELELDGLMVDVEDHSLEDIRRKSPAEFTTNPEMIENWLNTTIVRAPSRSTRRFFRERFSLVMLIMHFWPDNPSLEFFRHEMNYLDVTTVLLRELRKRDKLPLPYSRSTVPTLPRYTPPPGVIVPPTVEIPPEILQRIEYEKHLDGYDTDFYADSEDDDSMNGDDTDYPLDYGKEWHRPYNPAADIVYAPKRPEEPRPHRWEENLEAVPVTQLGLCCSKSVKVTPTKATSTSTSTSNTTNETPMVPPVNNNNQPRLELLESTRLSVGDVGYTVVYKLFDQNILGIMAHPEHATVLHSNWKSKTNLLLPLIFYKMDVNGKVLNLRHVNINTASPKLRPQGTVYTRGQLMEVTACLIHGECEGPGLYFCRSMANLLEYFRMDVTSINVDVPVEDLLPGCHAALRNTSEQLLRRGLPRGKNPTPDTGAGVGSPHA